MAGGIIYLVTNVENGMRYVGQTRRDLQTRWQEHCYKAMRGKGKDLNDALREFGPNAFTQEVLEEVEDEAMLNEREQHWIKTLGTFNTKTGYNCTKGGDSPISPGVPQKRRGKPREHNSQVRYRPPEPAEEL